MDELFDLFAAYHLGLFPDGTVKFGNVHDVALAFGIEPDEVIRRLAAGGLDPDSLVHSSFDLASAQADIQVSPEGVDLKALALLHYEHAMAAKRDGRDWEAELEADQAANAAVFDED
jgi:hypothetical protein